MITQIAIAAVAAASATIAATPVADSVALPAVKTYTLTSSQTELIASQHCSPLNRPCVMEKNLANQALDQEECLKVLVVKRKFLSAVATVSCKTGTTLPKGLEHLLPGSTNVPSVPWW